MSQANAPKIEFPCPHYPIKVLGQGAEDYAQTVFEIVRIHAPDCDFTKIQLRDSRNGRFCAVTVFITATGIEQLQALHADLMAHRYVQMVI